MEVNVKNIKIVVFSFLHFFLSLFYAYYCLGVNFIKEKNFLYVTMGGIQVSDSTNLLIVMIGRLPKFLFCTYVINYYIRELKINFLYIFLRTKKREYWLRKITLKNFISIGIYEIIFSILILVLKPMYFNMDVFLRMILMEYLQMMMFAVFSNMMMLFVDETLQVFIILIAIIFPILLTGVLYENNSLWKLSAKWIPFNYGNYNYMLLTKTGVILEVLMMLVVSSVFYIASVKKINNYELI